MICTEFCHLTKSKICLQGWLNLRPINEQSIIMDLFDRSFNHLLNFATTTFVFKMDVLEAFIIVQVGVVNVISKWQQIVVVC